MLGKMWFQKPLTVWMCVLLGGVISILLFNYYQSLVSPPVVVPSPRTHTPPVMKLKDYLWRAREETGGALLVDTPPCRLPDFNPFSREVMDLMTPWASNCSRNMKITHVKHNKLIINETELGLRGYSFRNVSCCYRTVERQVTSYSGHADHRFRYSDACYPINRTTTETVSGYIYVECRFPLPYKNDSIYYRKFHAFPKFSRVEQERILPKFSFWKNSSQKTPPSVLLLGIDSISRLHFHRSMNKTKALLQKIGAVDMKGYNRIGETTCENVFSVLVSHSHSFQKVVNICSRESWKPMDNHDFLWKLFSDRNYVTAFFEDSPGMAIFHSKKTGFVKIPTDVYIRPWMMTAYQHDLDHAECLGYQRSEEVVLKYIEEAVSVLKEKRTPYFFVMWLTELTHLRSTRLPALDIPLSQMLERLYEKQLLENTLLLVMSDHGYRIGKIVHTTSGWFEANLPLMYVRLPESLRKRFPGWQENLEWNTKLLTSHWDTHETLKDILRLSISAASNSTSARGMSLFKKIPFRNCANASIPSQFCSCLPEDYETVLNNSVIQHCVAEVVHKINGDLPRKCAEIHATTITAATVQRKAKNGSVSTTDYNLMFDATPRDFQFEAVATYDNVAGKVISIPKVQRTSKKNKTTQDTSCLGEHEAHLDLLCACG